MKIFQIPDIHKHKIYTRPTCDKHYCQFHNRIVYTQRNEVIEYCSPNKWKLISESYYLKPSILSKIWHTENVLLHAAENGNGSTKHWPFAAVLYIYICHDFIPVLERSITLVTWHILKPCLFTPSKVLWSVTFYKVLRKNRRKLMAVTLLYC